MLYWFKKTRQPQAGAMAYAFEPRFSLPYFPPSGPAIQIRADRRTVDPGYLPGGQGAFNPVQPQQIYYTQQIGIQGLAGIAAGQTALQPLIVVPGVS